MGRQFEITQERRLQPPQHRVYKITKTMAPTRRQLIRMRRVRVAPGASPNHFWYTAFAP
jgi:hypothetical protein